MRKVCTKCGVEKDIKDFGKRNDRKCGFRSWCKDCCKLKRKECNDKIKINNKNRTEYVDIKKCSCCKNIKSFDNFSKCNITKDGLQYVCKECERVRCGKSKRRYKDKWNIYAVERRNNNIHHKLSHNISSRITQELKLNNLGKNNFSTFKNILPYTVKELASHLEKNFEPWMNWDNYGFGNGKWVIDHIKPVSDFDYRSVKDKEFQECWALKNLRPLEYIKNLKKGNRIYA